MLKLWTSFRSFPLVAKIWDFLQTLIYGSGWVLVWGYMGMPYGADRDTIYVAMSAACGIGIITTFIMDDPVDAAKETLLLGLMPVLDRIWLWFDPRASIALVYLVGFTLLFFENLRQFGFWTWFFKFIKDVLNTKINQPRVVIIRGRRYPVDENDFGQEVDDDSGLVESEQDSSV